MTENKGEVGSYLKRIAQIPLLKPDEEIELGKQVKRMMTCWEKKEKLLTEKSYITIEKTSCKSLSWYKKKLFIFGFSHYLVAIALLNCGAAALASL